MATMVKAIELNPKNSRIHSAAACGPNPAGTAKVSTIRATMSTAPLKI